MNKKITEFLIKTNIITTDEVELYQYGFDLTVKKVIHVLVILLIGHIGGHFLGMVSFLIAYICLREYAGGYHARTTKGCYCCTVIVTLAVLAMLFIFRQLNDGGICICMLISGIVIWRQAPQETPSKPLSEIEKALYGKQARKNLLRTGILFGIGYCINREIATGVVSAWMVQMIMLFMGRCFSKYIRYS